MNHFLTKTLQICLVFLLYSHFVLAQDLEKTEQTEQVEQIEQIALPEIDTLKIYIQNAKYRQAIEFIDSKEPTKDLLFQKAQCCKSLNDYQSAIEILTALSEEYPDDITIKLQLASCYETASIYSKSIECYNNLIRLDSTNSYFQVRKADLLYRSEKYSLALNAYLEIDSTYNQNYIARCIAMCYDKLNQTDLAKDYFRYAWKLNEKDAYSACSLVKILVKEENFLSALDYSEKFIEKDSTNSTMNALNAYAYYNIQNYEVALPRFEKCLQRGDSSVIVNRTVGYIYYFYDKDSLARTFLQQAYLQDTTNNNLLYILGKVNSKLTYYDEATECFHKVIERFAPPSRNVLFGLYKELALANDSLRKFDRAIGTYSRALSYSSNTTDQMELNFRIAYLYDNELNNYTLAVMYYKQYRVCLFNYQSSLKEDEDEKEIKEIDEKLNALDEYLKQLMEKAKQSEKKIIVQ